MPKDLFSQQAGIYAKYRPCYPKELFEFIISFVKEKKAACDIATGNGQAAAILAGYFEHVYASDSSEKQIEQAVQKNNIQYSVGNAEQTNYADNSFDLITVAQAYHWLQMEAFKKEVTRIAKPGAIFAVWGYNIPTTRYQPLNALIRHFYKDTVGKYWDIERKFIDESYRTVPFDFEELAAPPFTIRVEWDKNELSGYLNSWSSVQHFVNANHFNPVEAMAETLSSSWPPGNNRLAFIFPLFLRLGKIVK